MLERGDDCSARPVLCFFSGWLGTRARFAEVAARLADEYEVQRHELAGFGARQHEIGPGEWTLEGAADEVEHAISPCDRVVLIGSSLAASVVLACAARGNQRISAVVAISGSARWTQSEDYQIGIAPEVAADVVRQGRARFLPFLAEAVPQFWFANESGERVDIALDTLMEEARAQDTELAIDILERCYELVDIRAQLPRIVSPVLFLHGDRDVVSPVEAGQYMSERTRGSELRIVGGAGHLPHLTAPAETASAIRNFLERRLGGSGIGSLASEPGDKNA